MKTQAPIRFGDFELDASERTLTRAGVPVAVSPKAFDLLAALAEQPGKLRTKQDLLDAIWPDTAVEEATLGRHISDLRRALGSDQRYIETVTRHGYRFLGEARPIHAIVDQETGRGVRSAPGWTGWQSVRRLANCPTNVWFSRLLLLFAVGACLFTYGGIRVNRPRGVSGGGGNWRNPAYEQTWRRTGSRTGPRTDLGLCSSVTGTGSLPFG